MIAALFTAPIAYAVEGNTAAGPIGGTDIRAAQLPPPGLYGGTLAFTGSAHDFYDGAGNRLPGFDALEIDRTLAGALLFYVPPLEVFGGQIGIGAMLPGGHECGRVFAGTERKCLDALGDPYVEFDWSRFFGTLRPSRYGSPIPIPEGLSVELGLGVVIPAGGYDLSIGRSNGLAIANNIWDVAPILSLTYTSAPILFDGTELSARAYWNNYRTNSATGYRTGDLVNIDFALTERIGRFQAGLAGFYAFQIEDDSLNGIPIPPDGRQARVLDLGAVFAVDFPELMSAVKVKALSSLVNDNAVQSYGVSLSIVTKLDGR